MKLSCKLSLLNCHATLVLLWPGRESWWNRHVNSRLSTLMHALYLPRVQCGVKFVAWDYPIITGRDETLDNTTSLLSSWETFDIEKLQITFHLHFSSMHCDPEQGLIYFILFKASHLVKAYEKAKEIMVRLDLRMYMHGAINLYGYKYIAWLTYLFLGRLSLWQCTVWSGPDRVCDQ